MRQVHRNHLWLIGWLVVISIVIAFPARARAVTSSQVDVSEVTIISPTDNQVISGVTQIVGTAIGSAFYQYELAYATEPIVDDTWTPIQPPIGQQARESILGAWDTASLPDGIYRIRLRVVRQDGSTVDDQVRVQVVNATATPLPTPLPTFTPTPQPGTATPGPSPTPLIWQPPTRTPRPTETPGGPTATPPRASLEDSPFHPMRLRQAATTGIMVTLVAFGLAAFYALTRAALRGQLRSWWWRFKREVINPIMDSRRRKKKRGVKRKE